VLAIKPQMLVRVGRELAPALRDGQLVISIIAGATTRALANVLRHRQIVRSMPNTPAQLAAA
jgi:pyrroline-5-carboxylate reductase